MNPFHVKSGNTRSRSPEKGSALFLILVGVALFAALSYTVADMMRTGNPNMITEEKARLFAEEMLGYARSMRQAAQSVRISNGCQDLQISFETPALTGYAHSPATADGCMIFNEAGGAINYLPPVHEWLDDAVTSPLHGQWFFGANNCFPGTGSATAGCDSDNVNNEAIAAALPHVRKEVCLQANKLLGITNPNNDAPVLTITGTYAPVKFTGTQSDGASLNTGGRMVGCFKSDGTLPANTYHFYQILLPR